MRELWFSPTSTPNLSTREEEHRKLQDKVDEWLARGNQITQIPTGVTGEQKLLYGYTNVHHAKRLRLKSGKKPSFNRH